MDPKPNARRRIRGATAATLVALLICSAQMPSGAHHADVCSLSDPSLHHSFRRHPGLRTAHEQWHAAHPSPTHAAHTRFHHRLDNRHERLHACRVVSQQRGRASWFDGGVGACGTVLEGKFAAHPSWPCGATVVVTHGNREVTVRIADRGPHVTGRILDLSPSAYRALAPLTTGTLDVEAYLVRP